jgi:hypothetical protein
MKRITRIFILAICLFLSGAMFSQDIVSYKTITVDPAADADLDLTEYWPMYYITGTVVLGTDWSVTTHTPLIAGTYLKFKYDATVTLGENHIIVFGTQIPDELATKKFDVDAIYVGGAWKVYIKPNFAETDVVNYDNIYLNADIVNADISASAAVDWSKMANLTASRALVSDASGDVTAATTTSTEIGYVNGVTSAIQTQLNTKTTSGAIVNADIAAGANIVATKLAALTADRAVQTSAAGVLEAATTTSTELGYVNGVTSAIQTQLNAKQTTALAEGYMLVGNAGGVATATDFNDNAEIPIGNGTTIATQPITGDITLTNAGLTGIAAGVIEEADLTTNLTYELVTINASFETGYLGAHKIYVPYDADLTYIYVCVDLAIEGSDNATINFQDNAANNMVGGSLVAGSLTLTAGSAMGTVFTSTVTGNNDFAAGEILNITTAKATAGGTVWISLRFTRE